MMKQDFSDLMNQIKQNQAISPKQKIVPITEKRNNETLFSFHISIEKLKHLKIMSIEQNKSIKKLINEAIDKTYFQ